MLLFSSGTFTIDGITVFPDHQDPNQFWYLPGPVGLANIPDSTEPQFLLIMYAPDCASNGIKGVGFLNVTLALKLSDDAREDIMGQIRAQFPDASEPRLAPVPFDEGTVQIVALDLQGSGGTGGAPPREGTFEAVEHILGAVSPELYGDNNALFALTLTEEGATILNQAFENGMAPVGGIYNLKFTGVRPALDVKITADLKRCYESFSVGLTAQAYWVSAGIDATFEKLRQTGAIKIEVVNLTADQSNTDKEQWALNLFKDDILAKWFEPSLSPTTAAAADASSVSLTLPPKTGGTVPPSPGGSNASGAPGGTHTGTAASNVNSGAMTAGVKQNAGAIQPAHPLTKPAAAVGGAPQSAGATTTSAGSSSPSAGTSGTTNAGAATGSPNGGTSAGVSTPPAPVASTGGTSQGNSDPATATNKLANAVGTAAAASSSASPFGVALRLKYVSADEQKTVTFEYNRMDAVQRVYAPQGYFGLLLDKIDRSKHFLEVDGTDRFFNEFSVTIDPPKDFATIGLNSAHVAIDYGDPGDAQRSKHGEFVFDPAHSVKQTWQVFEGLIQDTQYRYQADYSFDPESGWQGGQNEYTLPTVLTENRMLTLNPYDMLKFVQVSVAPGRIDPNCVDRVEVALQYASTNGWETATSLTVRPDSKPQIWKLRLGDKDDRAYSYSTTCFLKDGSTFKSDPVKTGASAILVNDPFPGGLDLTFQPVLNPLKTKLALVELSYHDDANNYKFETTLQMTGSTSGATRVHVPIIDRSKTQYQYRSTLIGSDDQKSQSDYITAQDPLVLVADGA